MECLVVLIVFLVLIAAALVGLGFALYVVVRALLWVAVAAGWVCLELFNLLDLVSTVAVGLVVELMCAALMYLVVPLARVTGWLWWDVVLARIMTAEVAYAIAIGLETPRLLPPWCDDVEAPPVGERELSTKLERWEDRAFERVIRGDQTSNWPREPSAVADGGRAVLPNSVDGGDITVGQSLSRLLSLLMPAIDLLTIVPLVVLAAAVVRVVSEPIALQADLLPHWRHSLARAQCDWLGNHASCAAGILSGDVGPRWERLGLACEHSSADCWLLYRHGTRFELDAALRLRAIDLLCEKNDPAACLLLAASLFDDSPSEWEHDVAPPLVEPDEGRAFIALGRACELKDVNACDRIRPRLRDVCMSGDLGVCGDVGRHFVLKSNLADLNRTGGHALSFACAEAKLGDASWRDLESCRLLLKNHDSFDVWDAAVVLARVCLGTGGEACDVLSAGFVERPVAVWERVGQDLTLACRGRDDDLCILAGDVGASVRSHEPLAWDEQRCLQGAHDRCARLAAKSDSVDDARLVEILDRVHQACLTQGDDMCGWEYALLMTAIGDPRREALFPMISKALEPFVSTGDGIGESPAPR